MIISELKSDRFAFNNWVRDSRGYFNSTSKMVIAGKYPTQVVLTIEETDSDKINASSSELCEIIMENIETLDSEGADFRAGMLLESYGGNSIPFTLMFFKCITD